MSMILCEREMCVCINRCPAQKGWVRMYSCIKSAPWNKSNIKFCALCRAIFACCEKLQTCEKHCCAGDVLDHGLALTRPSREARYLLTSWKHETTVFIKSLLTITVVTTSCLKYTPWLIMSRSQVK